MKHKTNVVRVVFLGIAVGMLLAVSSCDKSETTTDSLVSQNKLIESYITTRKLTDSVQKSGDLWYYRFKTTGTSTALIQSGDKVTLSYVLSVVSSSTLLKAYATNIKTVADANGISNTFTKYEPITVEVGGSGIFKGFDDGLRLLKEGDSALLLFPSTLGYGGEAIGAVPANSALAIRVYVLSVTK